MNNYNNNRRNGPPPSRYEPIPAHEHPRYATRGPVSTSPNDALIWRPRGVSMEGEVVMNTFQRKTHMPQRSFQIGSVERDPQSGLPMQMFKFHKVEHIPHFIKLLQREYDDWLQAKEEATREIEKRRRVHDLEPDYEAPLESERLHASGRRR